jgi:hypothetical protein
LEEQLPVDGIVKRISSEYRISPATAREDLTRFLGQLERHNLIERGAKL